MNKEKLFNLFINQKIKIYKFLFFDDVLRNNYKCFNLAGKFL